MKNKTFIKMEKLRILIALSLVILFFSGCEKGIFCTNGKGEIVSKTLSVGEFIELEASGAFEVVVTQGAIQSVELEGHQNIIEKIETSLVNEHLEIDLEIGCYNDYTLTIFITTPDITEVKLNGSGDIIINEFDELDQLDLIITGSGNIFGDHNIPVNNLSFYIVGSGNIDFTSTSLNIISEIEGSGNVTLSGTTNTHEAIITGSGSFQTFNLISDNTSIKIDGSGDCEVYADKTLNVDISGSGNVYYKGHPNLDIDISGSGNIYDRN